jgi:hypothetical protein
MASESGEWLGWGICGLEVAEIPYGKQTYEYEII